MSATASVLAEAIAQLAQAESAAAAASDLASTHDRDTEIKRKRLERMEADNRAFRIALALKKTPEVAQPAAEELEDLRTDMEIAGQITSILANSSKAAENAVTTAARKQREAHSNHLHATAINPALEEVAAAFDHLREASVKLMAAHHVVYRKLNDRPPLVNSILDLHGPMAEFLYELRLMDWAKYPYSIRPDWLPMHGQWWPDSMPGVSEHVEELLAAGTALEVSA